MAERDDQQSVLLEHISVLLYDVGSVERWNNRSRQRPDGLVTKSLTYVTLKNLHFTVRLGKALKGF